MKKTKGYVYYLAYKGDKIYIGSTSSKYPEQRYAYHIMATYDSRQGKFKQSLYEFIRSVDVNDISFHILDTISYTDKEELLELEQTYIDKYDMYDKGYNKGTAKAKKK